MKNSILVVSSLLGKYVTSQTSVTRVEVQIKWRFVPEGYHVDRWRLVYGEGGPSEGTGKGGGGV